MDAGAAAYETIVDQCHGQSPALVVRTLDAVHFACAKTCGEMELVATDKRLRAAAVTLGFSVYPSP